MIYDLTYINKHNQLKSKSFEEIHILFNNIIKWIEAFVPIDTELEKGSDKAVEDSEKAEEGSSKRAGCNLEQEDAKRQRLEEENESAQLKRCLEIIPDDDVTIEATPLSSKSSTIVDYKIYKEGKKSYFKSSKQMLVLLEYKVTTVFNKVYPASSRVTIADRVTTTGWIKTEMA
uniref:Uncharacterized protein n=1 Tax=Tanacetum cinerariifolium TaxID=118510 RepID=A0A6L2LIG3_TANCI|nr:hypothetical protein [Tanacetum cinerariifolium]